jgi:hypothetical protein
MAWVRRSSATSRKAKKSTERRVVRKRNAPLGAKEISVVIVK